MTHHQYQTMCLDILSNPNWYLPIEDHFTQQTIGEFRGLIGGAFLEGLIDDDTYKFINVQYPRTPTFYALPKTHKNLSAPPGRPIVSGKGSLTENASKLVDTFLLPHVMRLPSYIRDTTDLLKHIKGIQIPPDALLVAIDVEALYSSIPHEQSRASRWLAPF